MKRIILSMIALVSLGTMAQEKKEGWTRGGNVSLLFNQAAFNKKWTGGGTNNYGGNLSVSYDANYQKGNLTWDNKVLFDYGLTKVDGDDFVKKTNDRFSLTSLVGKRATEQWYYSFFLNFQTQFDKGYTYGTDAAGKATRTATTKFLSPGYLSFGPGMFWKKNDNYKVNIAPATARFVFVDKNIVGSRFGVEEGKTTRFEFGASVGGYAKVDLLDNITAENTLNLYSNYLDNPLNVDIDYTLNLVMKVNSYISANLVFQAIYDDNAVKAFQIRETFGAGLTLKF